MDTYVLSKDEINHYYMPPIRLLLEGETIVLPVPDLNDYGQVFLAEYEPQTLPTELRRHSIEVTGGDFYAYIHYFYGHSENELVIVYDIDAEKILGHYVTNSKRKLEHSVLTG